MRLDKYLAETAQCTRSEAKTMLSKGRVQVNGTVCKKGDTQLKENDIVAVDGRALSYQQFVYIMLNKPEGVVSASTDKRDTTVVDLVGDAYPRRQLFPAGRLDKTSTGFVLLTDDGSFAHDILAPKRHVSKTARPFRLPRSRPFLPMAALCGWCSSRASITRSSGCSACTGRA